jgi:hypothetical protein
MKRGEEGELLSAPSDTLLNVRLGAQFAPNEGSQAEKTTTEKQD